MNFRLWLENEDWQQEILGQQERDWKQLQQWTRKLSDYTDDIYSISASDPRESDMFVLYINSQEITEGDLSEIKERIQQIARENGVYL